MQLPEWGMYSNNYTTNNNDDYNYYNNTVDM